MNKPKNIIWKSGIARDILIELLEKEDYPSRLARKLGITFPYLAKIRDLLIKKGLIEFGTKIDGRTRLVKLTPKGKLIAFRLNELKKIVRDD